MWNDRRRKFVLASAASLALAAGSVLAVEASREPKSSAWAAASAGLGLGARAGIGAGFFAYDARLETSPRADDAPRAGVDVEPGASSVFALGPATRLGVREP